MNSLKFSIFMCVFNQILLNSRLIFSTSLTYKSRFSTSSWYSFCRVFSGLCCFFASCEFFSSDYCCTTAIGLGIAAAFGICFMPLRSCFHFFLCLGTGTLVITYSFCLSLMLLTRFLKLLENAPEAKEKLLCLPKSV